MQRDPDITARRRQLGAALATFRKAANLSQVQLGRRTHYDRTSITKIERGQQLPDRPFWQTADVLLDAGGILLSRYDELVQLVRARAEHERMATHVPPGSGRPPPPIDVIPTAAARGPVPGSISIARSSADEPCRRSPSRQPC